MTDLLAADLLSDESITAGVDALAHVHDHHLADMTTAEADAAREHWRMLVERVLDAVHGRLTGAGPFADGLRGRAIVSYVDDEEGGIAVTATFTPQLTELSGGDLDGTPAQVVAIVTLQGLEDDDEEVDVTRVELDEGSPI